jgi:hypothetical protein
MKVGGMVASGSDFDGVSPRNRGGNPGIKPEDGQLV